MNLASVSASFVVAAALARCAGVECEALDVIVDAREERARLISEPRGVRTDEHGRVRHETRCVRCPAC